MRDEFIVSIVSCIVYVSVSRATQGGSHVGIELLRQHGTVFDVIVHGMLFDDLR